jgi:hypothetical protein
MMEVRVDDVYTVLASLGGPLFITVAVVVVACIFREPINKALARINSVSGAGVALGFSGMQQDATAAPSLVSAAQVADRAETPGAATAENDSSVLPTVAGGGEVIPLLPGIFPTQYVIDSLMPKTAPDLRTVDRSTALSFFWYVAWNLERVYRIIHGTQIALILRANLGAVTRAEAMKLYESSVAAGNKGQSFDQWIGFPISQVLIAEVNGGYAVGVAGKMFLDYVRKEGYPTEKPW